MSGLVILYRSLRCNYCNVCWPQDERYSLCPACQEHTDDSVTEAISQEEAVHAAAEFGFGWWLWANNRI